MTSNIKMFRLRLHAQATLINWYPPPRFKFKYCTDKPANMRAFSLPFRENSRCVSISEDCGFFIFISRMLHNSDKVRCGCSLRLGVGVLRIRRDRATYPVKGGLNRVAVYIF
jgi:hypothetical protein